MVQQRFNLIIVFCLLTFFSCKEAKYVETKAVANPDFIHSSFTNLTAVMVHDIFSPPVASRNYAYPAIAAYEVIANSDKRYQSLAGQIRGLAPTPKPDTTKNISFAIASLEALNTVGKALIFSEDRVDNFKQEIYDKIKGEGVSASVFENSIGYGQAVAQHILAWADKDNYKQSRTFPQFSISYQDSSRWKPTPPAYMGAIEPHWKTIRPLVIDSADQFVPLPPTPYSIDKNSKFYEELMEVYNEVKDADEETKEIAAFWDCNPFVMNVTGHVMHATKKITPGGHWIGITGIACKQTNADLAKTLEAYAMSSIAVFDGFISCWDEKYRSNLTRPETVINEHFDQDWIPLLQTPPFPEHTSGHSVISRAAATALTSVFGDNFAYTDDVELEYGLPVRKFESFYQASEEAAISRLYGGIHYRPAIDYGVDQGQKVGDLIVERLNLKKS